MQIETQVLVLGSGPGGYSAAFHCADLGMRTIIIERYSDLGGVCLNVGCIPSKALLHISKLIQQNKELYEFNIASEKINIQLDINKIRLWKNNIIKKLSKNLYSIAKTKRNIKIIHGSGKFINNHTLQVSSEQHNINIVFDYAIIATGSYPISLPFSPDDHRIWNSTHALTLPFIPEKLLIVGSGSIGLEMSTVYNSLGSKINLIETSDQIMPILDKDVMRLFSKNLTKKKINYSTNTTVDSLQTKQDGIYAVTTNKLDPDIKNTDRYDAVLIAIGRHPNYKELNLNHLGINTNKYGYICVDKQMRTNISHIFAIGDVVGNPMLAHKSIYEGYIASEVISGKKHYFDAKTIPSVIYTDPEIAWAGCTEKEAQTNNINYKSVVFPWTALGKAITSNNTETGMTKLIFNKQTHRIIGGIVLGSYASEIIGEIALAIEMGCDVEDITLTVHAHPTLYESIALAADIYKKSIYNF